jgi:hypothetical protein
MVEANNAKRPPMGTVRFQEDAKSKMGPQNMPRPDKANRTMKALPRPAISPGQMSPKPTLCDTIRYHTIRYDT